MVNADLQDQVGFVTLIMRGKTDIGPNSMSIADLAKSATKGHAGPKSDLLPWDKVHQEYGSDIHCWIRLRAMSGGQQSPAMPGLIRSAYL